METPEAFERAGADQLDFLVRHPRRRLGPDLANSVNSAFGVLAETRS
jgi:hypothetical protein